MKRGAWRAPVHEVAKRWAWLKWLSTAHIRPLSWAGITPAITCDCATLRSITVCAMLAVLLCYLNLTPWAARPSPHWSSLLHPCNVCVKISHEPRLLWAGLQQDQLAAEWHWTADSAEIRIKIICLLSFHWQPGESWWERLWILAFLRWSQRKGRRFGLWGNSDTG